MRRGTGTGVLMVAVAAALAMGASGRGAGRPAPAKASRSAAADTVGRVVRSDAEWKRRLPALSYRVLRHGDTEVAFTGAYWNTHDAGVYRCAGCGLTLFRSRDKFDSGTGWPSYTQPIARSHVRVVTDTSLGMLRQEVRCARCDGHLGHVFDDGPAPTHLRYCMNSAALSFERQATAER